MFEIIVALILLVVLPMAFHYYIVKRYYNINKLPIVEEEGDNV